MLSSLYQADVSDYDSVGAMVEAIHNDHGTIDVLVNNAGITKDGAFKKWAATIGMPWSAPTLPAYSIAADMSSILCLTNLTAVSLISSSVNGQRAQFGQVNYAAAKAGMHGITKTLAIETASKGITVNTISPGYVATDMVMAVAPEVRNKIIEGIPVGRMGGTEEIAHLVSFLASPHSAFITGANYAINGGQHVF